MLIRLIAYRGCTHSAGGTGGTRTNALKRHRRYARVGGKSEEEVDGPCTPVDRPLHFNEQFYSQSARSRNRILITKIPFRHVRLLARKLRARAMRGRAHTRARAHLRSPHDRYEPKAGVSLICLMSRYCNDFASDLRLFIYSPAVLADRTLITGVPLVILTVLKSRRARCPDRLPCARHCACASPRGKPPRISWTS